MKVKIISTSEIVDVKNAPDDTDVEIIMGILKGQIFNSTDLKELNENQNFIC